MCDVVFEKVQDRAGKRNRTSISAEAASEGFFKKGFVRNFPEFTRKRICVGISFLIKLNSVDLQLH